MDAYAGAVLDQLDRLFNRGTIAGLNEGTLLERYVADGDEAAFAALVARHGPMVLGVCRRVLRDERDVEDAFQATFLVLVRRAGVIRDGELVGRWLHGVAHRVAVRARAHSARRFVHEQSTDEPVEPASNDSASETIERRELASIVDEEVSRLPSALRAPVVLCYLEGLSHDEAARRLRWPVGTVRSRMSRAREILRHRLARRGVTAEGAAIVASLARPLVPPEWLDAAVGGSLNFATKSAAAAARMASSRSVAIARRVLQTMIITKLSYIGAAGLGLVLALGGVTTLAFQGPGEAKPTGLASAAVQKAGVQFDAPVPPTPANRPTDDRNRQLASSVLAIGEDLDRAMRQLADLHDRLRQLEAELDPARRGRPTGPPTSSSPPPPAATKGQGAGDTRRPHYISFNGAVTVVSPDGSKGATYEPGSGHSIRLQFPAIRGVRREIIWPSKPSVQSPFNLPVQNASQPWLFALDLDRDDKVTRFGAFNVQSGEWVGQDVGEPVDRTSVGIGRTVTMGHRIYAFSGRAKRWGVMEWPPGSQVWSNTPTGQLWAKKDGLLYLFNDATGNWDDVYAYAISGEPGNPPE